MTNYSKFSALIDGVQRQVNLSDNVIEVGGMQLDGSTSGNLNMSASATTTSYSIIWPSAQGGSDTYLKNDGSGNLSWAGISGGVSSVAFADDSTTPIYAVSGSPVTSSGTLAITLETQNANTVFSGPSSGSAAQPSFRALVAGDIPSLAYANQSLSNLSSPTSFNEDLIPSSSLARSMGSDTAVMSAVWVQQLLYPSSMVIRLDTGAVYNASGDIVANFNNSVLQDNSQNSSVSWNSRILYDSSPTTSVDWGGRLLHDSSGTTSLDFGSRYLVDSSGNTQLSWSTSGIEVGATGSSNGALSISNSSNSFLAILQALSTSANYNFNLPASAGTAGQVLASGGGGSNPMTWISPSAGSVTSVAIAEGSEGDSQTILQFSGSPITSTGTIDISFASQATGNQVLASPNGSAGQPYFRALVASDIPSLAYANQNLSNLSSPTSVNQSLIPSSNGSLSLGSSSDAWADIYASSVIYPSGNSVNVQNGNLSDSSSTAQLEWSTSGVVIPNNPLNMSSNKITNLANGTNTNDAVTYGQLENALAGVQWRPEANLYDNVDTSLPATTSTLIDGQTVVNDDRVLFVSLSSVSTTGSFSSSSNSITVASASNLYVGMSVSDTSNPTYIPANTIITNIAGATITISANSTGAGSSDNLSFSGNECVWNASVSGSAITWSLAYDNDRSTPQPQSGDSILILSGTDYALAAFNYNGSTWVQFNGANQVQPGNALSKSGNTLNVQYDGSTIELNGSNELYVPNSGIGTSQLASQSVTYAKIQAESASTLLGNPTGSSASPSEITLGSTLAFSGSSLETDALSGDVTSSANSFSTTVSKIQGTSVGGTTGNGNVVFSASPTLTGTAEADNVSVSGDLVANTLQFSATYGGIPTLAANTSYAMRWGSPSNYYVVFTISSSSIDAGTVYTNNGATFTVISTTSSSTSLVCNGTGAPTASGTLTYVSGSPSGNLTFSASSSTQESADELYAADWDTSSNDLFWAVGLYNSATSTSTDATIIVTRAGSFALASSDTDFGSSDQGKPVWLGGAGSYSANSAFSPSSGDANMKLGIAQSSSSIWIDMQMMGVS